MSRNVGRCYAHFGEHYLGGFCRTSAAEYQGFASGRHFEHLEGLAQSVDVGVVAFQVSVFAVASNLDDVYGADFQDFGVEFVEEGDDGLLVGRGDVESHERRVAVDYVCNFRYFGYWEKGVFAVGESQFREFLGEVFLRKRVAERATDESE